MNWDQVEGNWHQFKGKVKEKWSKLTDNDINMIQGKQEQLAGKLQEHYGIAREEAERQIREFSATLDRAHGRVEPGSERSEEERAQKRAAGSRR